MLVLAAITWGIGCLGFHLFYANTFTNRSSAQSISSRVMHSGGARRIVCSCVSLQSIPSCISFSQ